MSKHTQGEWLWHDEVTGTTQGGLYALDVASGEERDIATVTGTESSTNREEMRANLTLMAAAPQLLVACEAALKRVEQLYMTCWGDKILEQDATQLRAAITKAKGDQP